MATLSGKPSYTTPWDTTFGAKGDAIPYLNAFAHRVCSLDSQAYGNLSRIDANERNVSKTDRLVADHMERWTRRQLQRCAEPARLRQRELPLTPPDAKPRDRWERAIVQARREIRNLIELGELDHNALTTVWIEQWAADLMGEEETDIPDKDG